MGFIQLKLPKKIRRKKLPNTARRRKALAFHEKWLKERGLDTKSLKRRLKTWTGYPFPDLSTDNSIPTSDRVGGAGLKRFYATQVPAGKTIAVAYNKGPYMIVDKKDFKTMGRKI